MAEPAKARVLAVEDNPDTRVLLRHLLQTRYQAALAGSIAEALRFADAERFDVFLLDINLGEERCGVELLGLLRAIPNHATTPALAVTAYALEDERDRILAGGFNGYLTKPFTRQVLFAAIDDMLQSR